MLSRQVDTVDTIFLLRRELEVYACKIELISPIWFLYRTSDPRLRYNIYNNAYFIHPKLTDQLWSAEMKRTHTAWGEITWFNTREIVFLIEEIGANWPADHATLEHVKTLLGSFCRRLRYCSRQATLSPRISSMQFMEADAIVSALSNPSGDIFSARPHADMFINKCLFESAVTGRHLCETERLPTDFVPPVYSETFLDAILAFHQEDYRRAILYAAITCESLAQSVLDEVYEWARGQPELHPQLRLIQRTRAGGNIYVEDPVYKRIREKGSFGRLLHECPLYLLGRSLLIDNESLYRDIVDLYVIRNKFAHGTLPDEDKATKFGVSDLGAKQAINCTVELFEWFGKDSDYPLPGGFLRFSSDGSISEASWA